MFPTSKSGSSWPLGQVIILPNVPALRAGFAFVGLASVFAKTCSATAIFSLNKADACRCSPDFSTGLIDRTSVEGVALCAPFWSPLPSHALPRSISFFSVAAFTAAASFSLASPPSSCRLDRRLGLASSLASAAVFDSATFLASAACSASAPSAAFAASTTFLASAAFSASAASAACMASSMRDASRTPSSQFVDNCASVTSSASSGIESDAFTSSTSSGLEAPAATCA
mmetsp:Transcript_2022/g.4610  ORF Transcript_2022/g.4610 Transcript_2022/m.4610 type:complete len:229 (+) Transcript_2022:895-1581(+)